MLNNKLLKPIQRRLATMISRCILKVLNTNTQVSQGTFTIYAEEEQQNVEYIEPYGFTSVPLENAEGLVLNVAGQRGACVAINLGNRQYRLKGLKNGEVTLYTDEGDKLVFQRNNTISLFTKCFNIHASEKVVIDTPATEFTGKVSTVGGITNTGGTTSSNGVILDTHVHSGVVSGASTTGKPL